MASQALYRRYRSQTFDELIGQEHVVQTLRNALAEGRIAHAYLFTGPRGVGKTTVARLLSKAVNCTAPLPQRPCGDCDMCRSIADGRAVDVIEMDAASHTSVEDAREIIERVQFRPALARTKVYIIDEVHMLSTAAFNALLKTLEEPPPHALFILATTEVHKVPATILSRCQRFVFNRHSVASTAVHLRQIADQEGFALESGVAEAIARAATGSMRDALSVLDQLMAYGGSTIALEQVRNLLGASESQEVAALVDAFLASDLSGALKVVADVASGGADLRQFTRDLVERLRAVMLLRAGADRTLIDASEDELVQIEQQASAADLGAVMRWVKLFSELDYQLRVSPYGQLPLELAVVESLTAPAAAVMATPVRAAATRAAPRQPVAAVQRQETPAAGAPPMHQEAPPPRAVEPTRTGVVEPTRQEAPPPAAPLVEEPLGPDQIDEQVAPAPTAPVPSIADAGDGVAAANADAAKLEHIESIWADVVRDVRVHDKTLQALLNSGVRPIDVKDGVLVLEVPSEWLMTRLEKPNLRQTVERVLSKHMGENYGIRCVVEAQQRENPSALREQIRSTRKDPLIKAAINIFDADIIGVENPNE